MVNRTKLVTCILSIIIVWNSNSAQAQPTQPWTLQSCIDYALQHNITIKKNRIATQSSMVDVQTAKAALFPSLSFSTGQNMVNRPYNETSSSISGFEIITNNSKTSYNGTYGLNAQWTVYNGNKKQNTLEQSKVNTQIAKLNTAVSENSIQESITQIYMQILYAAESVTVNENTLKVSQAQYDLGKELFSAGSISKSDLAQLQAQVSSDRYQIVSAQTTLENYKLQLKQILELEGEEPMNLTPDTLTNQLLLSPLPSSNNVYQSALSFRPEIEASRLSVQISGFSTKIAKAGYLPTINLSAGIGTNNTSGTNFTFSEQIKKGWNNSVGMTLSIPIFNNRQTKSNVEKAYLQEETSRLNLLDNQKSLYKTIEGFWLEANSARQRYVAATEKLNSAQISYSLVCKQFNLGMKNTVELLTEKTNLLQAQQEVLQSKYMAILNQQLLTFYQK